MKGTNTLRSIRLRLDLSRVDVGWLEGELVRRGARDAHATRDGIAVVVAAQTHAEAVARVRRFLRQALGFAAERGPSAQPRSIASS